MAFGIRATGTATAANTTTSVTINKPTGTVQNDVMYAVVVNGGANAAPSTVPSGWTLVASNGTAGGTVIWAGVYRRVAGASEGASYTWSGFTNSCTGCMVTVQEAVTGTPERNSSSQVNTATTHGSTAINADDGDLILAFAGVDDDLGTTGSWACATNPTSLTQQVSQASSGGVDTFTAIASAFKTGTGSTGALTYTVTGDDDNVGFLIAVKPAVKLVNVGQVTESDSGSYANGIGVYKRTQHALPIAVQVESGQNIAVGQVVEADDARQVARPIRALEADTAQAATRVKSKAAAQSTETDTAQPVAKSKARAAGLASETDTAQTAGRRKARAVGQTTSSELAQPVTARRSRNLGLTSETDAAQPVGRVHTRTLGLPVEADTAQAHAHAKRQAVGLSTEADTARIIDVGGSKNIAVGQVVEVDTARAIPPPLGRVVEADTAQAVGRSKARAVAQGLEADTAQPVGRTHSRALGLTTEADAPQPVAKRKASAAAQAVEADVAQPIAARKTLAVGLPAEADAAQPVARSRSRAVGQPSELDAAQTFAHTKRQAVGLATETDTVTSITRPGRVSQVTEVDTALVVRPVKSRTIGQPSEADTATAHAAAKRQALGVCLEPDSAPAVARSKTRALGLSTEASAVMALARVVKSRGLAQAVEADTVVGQLGGQGEPILIYSPRAALVENAATATRGDNRHRTLLDEATARAVPGDNRHGATFTENQTGATQQ